MTRQPHIRPDLLSRETACYGSRAAAIQALANDGAGACLSAILADVAAQEEAADPTLKARRLHAQAQDLDHRAEPLWAEAAEAHGKAAARRLRGETDLAETFLARAASAERLAASLEAEALAKRLEAATLENSVAMNTALYDLIREIAA